jgi:hypothetical protein
MLLIDAHVHIYDCFDLEKFFDSAYANFKSAAERLGRGKDFTGILLLAETSMDNWFSHLANYANGDYLPDNRTTGSWIIQRTKENCSLYVKSNSSKELFIIAGNQLVTAEGLEVLALIMNGKFEDGIPIVQLIKTIKIHNGLPVIPWGFGKWIGRRGKVLKTLIENAKNSDFFLGDNGGRPNFMRSPSFFRLSNKKGIRILSGTDPLPLKNDNGRAGSFGFVLENPLSDNQPAKDLKNYILNLRSNFGYYGFLERPYPFIYNQIRLLLRPVSTK